MLKVEVSESVLRWAVERSGKRAAVRQKFPKLQEWERGNSRPTLRQLENLAKLTSTPLGYFFLSNPPEEKLPIPHFRTLGEQTVRRPSADLIETFQTMDRRQAWLREYLIEQGQEPLPFVRSTNLAAEPHWVAHEIRRTLQLEPAWATNQTTWTSALRELRNRIEEVGILVVVNGVVGNNTHRKLDVSEFRGFVLVDDYAPLVFVNGADGKAAQMFTLAHELSHLWLGSSAAFDLRELQPADDETEQACNRIAAEFLVPEAELRPIWSSVRQEPEPFRAIARLFKVSELVAARRAQDLGVITKGEFLRFYREYEGRERSTVQKNQEGGDFYASQSLRISRRFAEAVVRAASEGKLLYREAYQLTGLYGRAFERYAELLGFGG